MLVGEWCQERLDIILKGDIVVGYFVEGNPLNVRKWVGYLVVITQLWLEPNTYFHADCIHSSKNSESCSFAREES